MNTIEFTISPYSQVKEIQSTSSETQDFMEGGDVKIQLKKQ
jgi:hypothetical protein